MSFGLIWFDTKPKQMSFGNWPTRPKQMGPNEITLFGAKPKQMSFGNWLTSPKQMSPNEINAFGTKPNCIW